MYEDHRHGGGGVFGAFLLGGLIGAAFGLLFAPRAGENTRKMLVERGQGYLDQGRDVYEDGRERLVEAYSSTKDNASEKTEELKAKIDEAREKLRVQVGEGVHTASEKVGDVKVSAEKAVDRGAEAAKKGLDVAADRAQSTLDMVAEKSASEKAAEKAALMGEPGDKKPAGGTTEFGI